jgi:hypothetical protein
MKQLMSGDNLSLISKNAGADNNSVKSTLETGLPLLLGAINHSASKPEGMSAIVNSLSKTGTNNPVDDVTSYLGAPSSTTGSDMLSSILGNNSQTVHQALSNSSGLPTDTVSKILSMALPLVMGSISKNLGGSTAQGDLSKSLGEQSQMALSNSPSAAGVVQQLAASEKSSGGLMDRIKKIFSS